MKNLEITAEISGKFGSDFQRQSAEEEALRCLLVLFQSFYHSKHKNNKIKIWFDGKDL